MGKASIDDCLTDHPKFLNLGPQVGQAGWLWLAGLLYARRTLTDGFIPRAKVATLVAGQRGPYALAGELVRVGLWSVESEGFRIHDFLDHNPTKAQVQAYQHQDRVRKQARRGGQVDPVRPDSESESIRPVRPDSESESIQTPLRARGRDAKYESAYESESAGSGSTGESAREPIAIAPAGGFTRPKPRPRTGLMGNHTLCPQGTWAACERGICVPPKLAEEWYLRLGGDRTEAEAHVSRLVDATISTLGDRVPGDKPYDFWRAVWAAAHPAVAPAAPSPHTKGHSTMAALSAAFAARRQV